MVWTKVLLLQAIQAKEILFHSATVLTKLVFILKPYKGMFFQVEDNYDILF
jgi:hypothetical protein